MLLGQADFLESSEDIMFCISVLSLRLRQKELMPVF